MPEFISISPWFVSMLLLMIGLLAGILIYNSLSGQRLIKEVWDFRRLKKYSLNYWGQFWVSNSKESDIVVCLTTIPSRLPYLSKTLKSLMAQTYKAKQIRLHLPTRSKREQKPYEIPEELLQLQSLKIIRCEDYGPATKLLPALNDFKSDEKLLIVDDDYIYPEDLIENFYNLSGQYPDIAITSSGWVVPNDLTDRHSTWHESFNLLPPTPLKCTRVKEPQEIDILRGCGGYLVRPEFFNLTEIFDYSNAPEAAFFVDDVWISAHCTVPKFTFPAKQFGSKLWHQNSVFDQSALGLINQNGEPNTWNNTITIRHFSGRWLFQKKPSPLTKSKPA